MKWVFTALIALNIIALSYFFMQKDGSTQAELNPEVIEWVSVSSEAQSDNVTASEIFIASTEEASSPLNTIEASSEEQIEEKKICLASVEVDEKTYGTLKPKLAKIDHKTKRLEKDNPNISKAPQPQQLQSLTLYWVHIPVGSEGSTEPLNDLKSKGFETHLMGNQISLGLFRNPAGAANLKQQAFNAGYTQTTITEKQGVEKVAKEKNEPEKIISYRLSFSPLISSPAIKELLKSSHNLKVIACP